MNFATIAENAKHGDFLQCPTCLAPGLKDTTPGQTPTFEDWITYNTHLKIWECWDCEGK